MRLAAALVLVAACRGGAAQPPRATADESVAIVIHAGRSPSSEGRADVNERRWLDVPARGELVLGTTAVPLELASVVVESESDPGSLVTRSCRIDGARGGLANPTWLWGRTIAVVLADGSRIEGVVVDVGDPMAIVADDSSDTRTIVPIESVRLDSEEAGKDGRLPFAGDLVTAHDRDGREVFGTLGAEVPERLVLRTTEGKVTSVPPADVTRLSVSGAPAQWTLICEVESPRPGRHLVRFSYATRGMHWRAVHRVTTLRDAAPANSVTTIDLRTTYVIDAWGLPSERAARVDLVLGVPGEVDPPVRVWSGDVTIGGGAVRVESAPSPRRARLDRVYRGAEEDPAANPRRPEWRDLSGTAIWRELAFERTPADAPGPVRVAVRDDSEAVRWVDGEIPGDSGEAGGAVRVPLRLEPELVGFRRKLGRDLAGQVLVDEVSYSVANRGAAAVEVVVEEPLRGVVRPRVVFEKERGELLRDRWRARITVPAAGIVQGQVVLQYRFKRY